MRILGVTFYDAISGKNCNALQTATGAKPSEIRECYPCQYTLLPLILHLSSSDFFISDDL